jgi:hypothetical protein
MAVSTLVSISAWVPTTEGQSFYAQPSGAEEAQVVLSLDTARNRVMADEMNSWSQPDAGTAADLIRTLLNAINVYGAMSPEAAEAAEPAFNYSLITLGEIGKDIENTEDPVELEELLRKRRRLSEGAFYYGCYIHAGL